MLKYLDVFGRHELSGMILRANLYRVFVGEHQGSLRWSLIHVLFVVRVFVQVELSIKRGAGGRGLSCAIASPWRVLSAFTASHTPAALAICRRHAPAAVRRRQQQ